MLHIPHLSHFTSEFLEVTVTFPLTVNTQKTDRAPGHILDVPAETGAFGITAHRAGGGCPPVWGTGLQHVFTPAPSAPPVVPTVPVGTPYWPQAAEGHLGTGPGMTPLEQSWCRGRECSGGGRGGAGCWWSPCPGGDTQGLNGCGERGRLGSSPRLHPGRSALHSAHSLALLCTLEDKECPWYGDA